MTGTRPTFYLIQVTELSPKRSVICGQPPATQTGVLRCVTTATHMGHVSVGMEDTECRELALKRFLVFKTLAKSPWERIYEGVKVD